ncbi:MAG: zinc-dependent metalloprotease [Anaerolineales bacterium]|nr:zinc-dependent metalloprotease [Anaerolineales bacterium]
MKPTSPIRPGRAAVWLRLFGALVIVSTLTLNLPPVEAQGSPPSLFVDAGQTFADAPQEAAVARARVVRVNVGLLYDADGNPLDQSRLPEIALDLFPDASYTGVVTSLEQDQLATYWIGDLKEVDGYFYLVMTDDIFLAHIASPLGIYEVSWAGGDLYRIEQVDQSQFVDEASATQDDLPGEALAGEQFEAEARSAALPEEQFGAEADPASRIDVMVVYTSAARAAAGSTKAMKARIALAIKQTNTSYIRSGVKTRLRLVHVEEAAYAETGNLASDLGAPRKTTDAFLNDVHKLRNAYGADMVAMIVRNGGKECGRARAVRAKAYTAFQVTVFRCMTSNYALTHQFGHLQGARDDMFVDKKLAPYAYGHGYVHLGKKPADRWRTIMGENNKCAKAGYNCTRLLYWSNPSKRHNGAAMGDRRSKNYMVLNATARTVANFRKQVIASDFNSTFNGSTAGWTAVAGTWTLFQKSQYRSAGVADGFASARHAGAYGDLTYEVKMRRTGTCPIVKCANYVTVRGAPNPLDPTGRWNKEYKFAYSNLGSYAVFLVDGPAVTTLQDWTDSSAVVQGGWNQLKVVAVGSSFKFYINGKLVWTGSDPTLRTGQVGFGFYREAGAGLLYVDWARLTTTATAEVDLGEAVEAGFRRPGGNDTGSP